MDANMTWFIENQKQLVYLYEDVHIIIRNCAVVATFHDGREAREWAKAKFADGDYTYLLCLPGEQAYTTTVY